MDLNRTARAILARKGIDPDTMPAPAAFDVADFLTEQAEASLALVLPQRFLNAVADHPQVLAWVGQFTADPAATPSLLLLGPVGVGKTHQAFGALRAAVLATARRPARLTWRVTTHPDFNAAMRPQPDDGHIAALDDFTAADLLVLDDLGSGKATDWTADTLYRLIDARWANQRPTIATSNLAPDALRLAVGDRIVSRLADGTVVALKGEDRRRAASR
jgi:DNA replication protein DnaC